MFLESGHVWACGSNSEGRTGLGTELGDALTPQRVIINIFSKNISAISAGSEHSLVTDGTDVYAFGSAASGKLGLANITDAVLFPTPIDSESFAPALSAEARILSVSAGSEHSLIATTEGGTYRRIKTWIQTPDMILPQCLQWA